MHLKTLQDAILFFAIPQNCIDYMVKLRWPDGRIQCPTCGSETVTWLMTRNLFQCKGKHAKRQFSVKVGTVFEDSPISLSKWLLVTWMMMGCRNGISSYEVARTIGITQKSAWFMLHRLRKAMTQEGVVLSGIIEGDETYVGGQDKFRHRHKQFKNKGRSQDGKTIVFGLLERGGKVHAQVMPDSKQVSILPVIEQTVAKEESLVITDDFPVYAKLPSMGFIHEVITHLRETYADGRIHTNTIENFWSCLKRTLKGTYIAVTPKHLNAYVAEQGFRFNHRRYFSEEQRFAAVIEGTTGKRLTYKQLVSERAA